MQQPRATTEPKYLHMTLFGCQLENVTAFIIEGTMIALRV